MRFSVRPSPKGLSVSWRELAVHLALQLFTEKGYQPVSARVVTDRDTGRSRGYGFVELGPEDDAKRAIGEFNGMNVEGRALQVNEARPQESRGGGYRSGNGRGFSGGRSGRGGGRNY